MSLPDPITLDGCHVEAMDAALHIDEAASAFGDTLERCQLENSGTREGDAALSQRLSQEKNAKDTAKYKESPYGGRAKSKQEKNKN